MNVRSQIYSGFKLASLVILLAAIAFLLFGHLILPETPARKAETIVKLKAICRTLQVLGEEEPAELTSFVGSSDLIGPNEFKRFLKQHESMTDREADNLVIDGWRNPLNFLKRKDATNSVIAPQLLRCPGEILVWSNGPNGTNQFGGGDDIVYVPNP